MTHLPPHIGGYEILGLLGTGGMAEVFLGRIRGPGHAERPVVVKRILPHLARQQHFVDMFRDEARIAARINHPNVVQVHELGQADHELFLVMEYLAGESAAGIAKQLAHRKKLLSFGLCAYLLGEVCAGLHAAHDLLDENGDPLHIVHRDVSPANIFVTYEGEVKVLDFGIAVAANRLSKTDAGQVKGKYAYMSPEQCRGKTLDRRSDVFSLGTVLYELSTCRRLFKRASDMETLESVCNEAVLPPSQLVNNYPPELERICLRALQKDPNDRYQTALQMRNDLIALARSINKEKLPDRALAKVMRKLFVDRIQQKKQMMNRLKAGEQVSTSSMPSEDQSIELPAIPRVRGPHVPFEPRPTAALAEPLAFAAKIKEIPSLSLNHAGPATGGPTTNSQHDDEDVVVTEAGDRPQRRMAYAVLALVLPLAVGLSAGIWWTNQGPRVPSAATAAPPPTKVQIDLDTTPTEAEVYRDGRLMGRTPMTLSVIEGSDAFTITLRKSGFVDLIDTVTPTTDQKLRLSLQEEPPPQKRLRKSKKKASTTDRAPPTEL